MAQKKYASLSTLTNLVDKIKELFATKSDLNTELAKKANSSHTHSISDTTNLQSTLDSKVPTSRTINNKPLSANITLSASDVGAATSTHDHNSVYYTQSQVDAKLSGKSDKTHNHDSDYADIDHNHDGVYAVEGHNHDTKYDAKGTATSTVSTHNTSTSAHNDIRALITDLTTKLNNFLDVDDTTTDQLSEVITLINNNKGTLESLTTSKINVSDIVNNLTTSSTSKVLSAAQGVAIKALIDALQAEVDKKVTAVSGKGLSTNDYTTTEKNKLSGIASGAEVNQNAFSNIAVSGQTTVAADAKTDTVTFAGSNVSITTDATNDKVTFTVADGTTSAKGVVQLTDSVTSTSTTTAATPKNVKAAYDLATTAKTTADSKANASHIHTVANITDLTATATELNYMDGVTSNVQAQLDGKAASSHNHSASNITSGTLSSDRLPTVPIAKGGTGATTSADALTNLGAVPLAGGKMTGTLTVPRIYTDSTSATLGSASTPFQQVYAQSTYIHDGTNYTKSYGSLEMVTEGTTSTVGQARLSLGNGSKSGNAGNAQGTIRLYGTGTSYHQIQGAPTSNRTITLPNKSGTLATTDDVSTTAVMTAAEYTALEEAEATNANTLYMITDAEEEVVPQIQMITWEADD